MSSLAGALVPPPQPTSPQVFANSGASDDVEMQATEAEGGVEEPEEDSEPQGEPDEEMADLFGNDNEVDEVKPEGALSSAASAANDSERLATPEAEHRKALEYAEDEEPGTIVAQRQEADVSFPNIPLPKSSDGDHWVIRMPTFVTVDSKPYHSETYLGPEQDDDDASQSDILQHKSNIIKLKVQNTVRWRWIRDELGQDRRQSNSRVIRWSDGSMSLRLGKEQFDIIQDIDTSGGVPRQSLGGPSASQSQSQSQSQNSQSQPQNTPSGGKSQGLTYLVAQHKRAEVLQSEAVVTGFMSLRPTGMQSEIHRMLVRAVGQKHNKVARLRMAPDPTMDPEREKLELIKQSAKKSKKKVEDDGFGSRRKRGGRSRKRTGHDVWSDDDQELDFEASEDEVMDGLGSSRKLKRKSTEEDTKKGGNYQEDDFLVADSSDEDGDGVSDSGGRKRRKQKDRDEDVEEDPLDRLDAKIREREEEERKRKRRESAGSKDGGRADAERAEQDTNDSDKDEEQMDIESEEDEDEAENKIRRAGGSGARKRRPMEEEEEE